MKQNTPTISVHGKSSISETKNKAVLPGSGTLSHQLNLPHRRKGIRSVNVTSDNRYLIISFEKSTTIRVLDLEKLEYLSAEYEGHTDSVRQSAICRDNKTFFTASWDGSSRKYDLHTGACSGIFSGFGRCPSCFLSPDEKYLFTASYDSELALDGANTGRCWDVTTGKIINVYKHTEAHTNHESMDIAFDQNGVYTGSDDGYAYRWDQDGEEPLLTYFSFSGTVRKIAISAQYLVAACTDGFIRIHYRLSGDQVRDVIHIGHEIRDVKISEDETRIWSSTASGSVSCHHILTGELLFRKDISPFYIWSICLFNNEQVMACTLGDGSIKFLSADKGQVLATLQGFPDNRDVLITSAPDKTFPKGFFYTNNDSLIDVMLDNPDSITREILKQDDQRRIDYLKRLNLKNLIATRIKKRKNYDSLTKRYAQNRIPAKMQTQHKMISNE